jgi:hypothetical protein
MGRALRSGNHPNCNRVELLLYLRKREPKLLSPPGALRDPRAAHAEKLRVRFAAKYSKLGMHQVIDFALAAEDVFSVDFLVKQIYAGCIVVDFDVLKLRSEDHLYSIVGCLAPSARATD